MSLWDNGAIFVQETTNTYTHTGKIERRGKKEGERGAGRECEPACDG